MSLRDIRTQWSALAKKELRTRLRSSSPKSCPGPGRLVAMCMPTGISRSWAAAHSGSYIGLSYPFPSGGKRGICPRRRPQRLVHRIVVPLPLRGIDGDHAARQPHLGTALQLLDTLLHIVHVDHGDALETLGLPGAKLDEPVVVSSKNLRQQST